MGKHIRFDWAVKKILRSKSNFGVLEGFLTELLDIEIKICGLLESESNKEREDARLNRVDILAEDADKKLIIIEIQTGSEVDYFQRIAFNAARLISEYLDKSQAYANVKKVITVNIVYFDIGQGHDYIYHGNTIFKGLHDENDILKPSATQIRKFNIKSVHDIFPEHYIIKVNNFDGLAKNSLDEWIYFLKNSEIKDEFSAKGLSEAREKLNEVNLTPTEREEYITYTKYLRDEASFAFNAKVELEEMRLEAERKGKIEGERKGKIETARAFLKEGISLDNVLRITVLQKTDLE